MLPAVRNRSEPDPEPLVAEAGLALVAAGRQLAEWGLVIGSAGNLSIRVGDTVLVTASGTHLDRLTPADLVAIDLDGAIIERDNGPTPVPTSETPLHLAIYAATDAAAVAHTHAASSAAVSCVETVLPPLHYTCLQLGGPVPVAPYATYGSPELAANVVAALGTDRFGALMANHGSITYGSGAPLRALDTAMDRLAMLEWLCELHVRATALGSPRVLTSAELDDVVATSARMRQARAEADS